MYNVMALASICINFSYQDNSFCSFCMGLDATKPMSFGFLTKPNSNQSPQLQSLARKNEILLVESLDRNFFKKGIIKALISLRRCAGWSAPLLIALPEDRFYHVEANI